MATPAEIQAKLEKLTRRQCQILSMVCHSMTYVEIGKKMGFGVKLIQAEMTTVYRIFELTDLERDDKRGILINEVCPIHEVMVKDPDKDCRDRVIEPEPPPPDPRILAMVIRDAEAGLIPLNRALVASGPRGVTVPTYPQPIETPPTTRPPISWLLVGCLGFLLLATLIVLFEAVTLFQQQARSISSLAPSESAFIESPAPQTVVVTETVLVTQVPVAVNTAPAPTSAATNLLEVTPSVTSIPPVIPLPTFTLLPLVLPFKDSFDRNIRPEWRVLSGHPLIVSNRLKAAGDGLDLEIGDNLRNYVVDFDFSGINEFAADPRLYCNIARTLRFSWSGWGSSWDVFQNDRWVNLSGAPGQPLTGHLHLLVAGNTYIAQVNGKNLPSISYGTQLSGPFGLTFPGGPSIANFSISAQ